MWRRVSGPSRRRLHRREDKPGSMRRAPNEVKETMRQATSVSRLALMVSALALLGLSFADLPSAHAQELTEARRIAVARRLQRSTVSVIAGPSTGSGFVVGDERWIITNFHVVEPARGRDVQVRFGSGVTLSASVIEQDSSHDLAILEVRGGRVPSPPLTLGDSDDFEVGQTVLAFGSPFGLDGTLTEGIVSARRDVPGVGGGLARRLIQTDADINPGNSGGPLFNHKGEVVGVNTWHFQMSEGLNFSIPIDFVKHFVENRDAFAFDRDNPNSGYRYLAPPRRGQADPLGD